MPARSAGLPAPTVPFAVHPLPVVRPDLWPLDRDPPGHVDDPGPRTLLRADAEVPHLVAAKRALLTRDPEPWTSHDIEPGRAVTAGQAVAAAAARAVPALVDTDDAAVTLPDVGVAVTSDGHVTRRTPGRGAATGDTDAVMARLEAVPAHLRLLEAVALAVGEDLVLVDDRAIAVWVHVCAPSGWDPGVAAGSPIAALHGPIPDADRLRDASRALGRAITTRGPHVRWTWGLTEDDALARHARHLPAAAPATLQGPEMLTFRAERQTTWPLPTLGLGLFTIRVHRAPLGRVAATPTRRDALAAAIASLSPELAAYKGVDRWRDRLLAWLASPGPDRPTVPPAQRIGLTD